MYCNYCQELTPRCRHEELELVKEMNSLRMEDVKSNQGEIARRDNFRRLVLIQHIATKEEKVSESTHARHLCYTSLEIQLIFSLTNKAGGVR